MEGPLAQHFVNVRFYTTHTHGRTDRTDGQDGTDGLKSYGHSLLAVGLHYLVNSKSMAAESVYSSTSYPCLNRDAVQKRKRKKIQKRCLTSPCYVYL